MHQKPLEENPNNQATRRSIGYQALLHIIKALRKPKVAFDHLIAMDNGFFMIKFSSMDDYDFSKYCGVVINI